MRSLIKKYTPKKFLIKSLQIRDTFLKFFYQRGPELNWEDDYPWSSPNVWNRLIDFYMNREKPTVLEYGTGLSSIHHTCNILKIGGTYIGVEHELNWFIRVNQEIFAFCLRNDVSFEHLLSFPEVDDGHHPQYKQIDSNLKLIKTNKAICTVELKYRPVDKDLERSQADTKETEAYVSATDRACDAVIVDGRVRKKCVNFALDTQLVKSGGMLALFEAWRGRDGYMGYAALTGASNYQPEVERMLSLGGELVDGSGLDSWPDLKKRRTFNRTAYEYPLEACFLAQK